MAHNIWRWLGIILFLIALLAEAGIYTLFPAAPIVYLIIGSAGVYIYARPMRGR